MKTYRDSKEFPLYNFERVQSTGDFFYIIKGYDYGDEVIKSQEECQAIYETIIEDYLISMNSKNNEIERLSKLKAINVELSKFKVVQKAIELEIKARSKGGAKNKIEVFLEGVRVQKSKNINHQLEFIEKRILKLENDIEETIKKLKTNDNKESSNINEMITNVELVLERSINLKEISLYRFGIMQNQAIKKIEIQNKNGR